MLCIMQNKSTLDLGFLYTYKPIRECAKEGLHVEYVLELGNLIFFIHLLYSFK